MLWRRLDTAVTGISASGCGGKQALVPGAITWMDHGIMLAMMSQQS